MASTNPESRSPMYGTTTFTPTSPSRLSGSTNSGRSSLEGSDVASEHRMRRVIVSPTLSPRHGTMDTAYTDENSFEETEVENALQADDDVDDTEDVGPWTRSGTATTPSTFTSPLGSYSTFSPTYTSASTGFPFFSAGRILSMITERTEQSSPRPVSRGLRSEHPIPEVPRRSAVVGGPSSPFQHGRSATDPSTERVHPPPSRRAGELIAFFEEKRTESSSPIGHSRTASAPGGPRSPSPFFTSAGQATSNIGSTTGYGTGTGYGYGTSYGYGSTGYESRSSSPVKSQSGSSGSSASSASVPISTLLSPPLRGLTSASITDTRTETRTGRTFETRSPFSNTYTNTFTNTLTNTMSPSNTYTGPSATLTNTPTVSPLRRPQPSPRSPLTSVRNIVAAWKERTPLAKPAGKSSLQGSATSASPPPGEGDSAFGFRRQTEGARPRAQEGHSADESRRPEDTSIDMADLIPYTKGHTKPDRIGLLWYLNVHASPPYRWQRCQALLYPHMLLLSWIAPGGGRGVVSLDLLNCTSVVSVPSPTHPSAQDDVGTIAARLQSAERGGQPLVDMLVPFHLLYGDGVERVAAESLLERQRWVNYLWDAIHRPMIDRSETRSPTGSITGSLLTIQSYDSRSSRSSSARGSASTVFVPPFDSIPEMSDLQSRSSSRSRLSHRPSLISSHHTGTVDDTAIVNQEYVYPGDRRVVPPSRHSSLRRTSSLTDLDEGFASAVDRARGARPGLGFASRAILGAFPVTVSSGSSLGSDVRVTPPPTGRSTDRGSGSQLSTSSDAFFSPDTYTESDRSRTHASSFYSTTSFTGTRTGQGSETFTGLKTDETALAVTSVASGTQIVSSTLSPRTTDTASILGDSHDSATPTTSSTASLSRANEVRRRPRPSSRSWSSSYVSRSADDSSDKENSESYTPSESRSRTESTGYYVSRSSELSSISFCSSVSRSTTPYPSASTLSRESSEIEVTPSQASSEYATAPTPSSSHYESLPTIPSESEYDTAEVCSTEFVTAEAAPSEPSTIFITAELCPSIRSSPVVVEIPVPVEPAVPVLVEPEEAWVSITPPYVPSIPDILSAIDLTEGVEPTSIDMPSSTLSSTLESSTDLEAVSPPRVPSSFVSTPTESILGPTLLSTIAATPTLPAPPTITSVTESDVTPDVGLTATPSLSSHPLSSPSAPPSHWAQETNESYESSVLQASPSMISMAVHEGPDTTFETSFLRPSGSMISSADRLSPIPETPTAPSSLLVPPSTASPFPVLAPTISSPTDVSSPTSMSWAPSLTASLSRTLSSSSATSSISMSSSVLGPRSLMDVPIGPELSTEPSLLTTVPSPAPVYVIPPAVPTAGTPSLVAPSVSMSVSISTPHTNIPSIREDIVTIPSDEGRSEILTHDINRLLQHLHDLDQARGQDNKDLADNVQAIRDELHDLSDFLRRRPQATTLRDVPREDRPVPGGPRDLAVSPRPISLSPPHTFRVPSPDSIMSSATFLSSHHSDDDLLAEIPYTPWSPHLSPEEQTVSSGPSERAPLSSSVSGTSGPYAPSSPSSPSPSLPPHSVTPSTPSSTRSASTARPAVNLGDLRDILDRIKDQVGALWDGQLSTNHVLDELRGRQPPHDDELMGRLRGIEDLLQQPRQAEPAEPSVRSQRTESSSEFSDLDRLRDRLRDLATQRDQPAIHMPTPRRPGPSLDEELAALLRAQPHALPPTVEPPPRLIPFEYHPARVARPRSTSPTLPARAQTAPIPYFSVPPQRLERATALRGPRGRPTMGRPESGESSAPVIPPRPLTATGRRPGDQDFDERMRDIRRRRPTNIPPPEPIFSTLHDRSHTAPADIGRDQPQSWYQPRPGAPGAPQPSGPTQGAAPAFIPMPPGPTVVQVPLFDTLMDILRENWNAQRASVEQQRELMRYMRDLNDWLGRDVNNRQSEIQGVAASVNQLRHDLQRLGVGMRPPGDAQPQPPIVVPMPPGPGIGGPGFQPFPDQSGVIPPTMQFPVPDTRADRTPSPDFTPVIPGLVGLGPPGATPGPAPHALPLGVQQPVVYQAPDAPPARPYIPPPSDDGLAESPPHSLRDSVRRVPTPRRRSDSVLRRMPAESESSASVSDHEPHIEIHPSVPDVVAHDPRTAHPGGPAAMGLPPAVPMPGGAPPPGVQAQQPFLVVTQPPQPGQPGPFMPVGMQPYGMPLTGGLPPTFLERRPTSETSTERDRSRYREPYWERDRRDPRRYRSPSLERDPRDRRRYRSPSEERDPRDRRRLRRRRPPSSSPSVDSRHRRYSRGSYTPPGTFIGAHGPPYVHRPPTPVLMARSPERPIILPHQPPTMVVAPETRYGHSPPPVLLARDERYSPRHTPPPVLIGDGRYSPRHSPVLLAREPSIGYRERYSPRHTPPPTQPIIIQPQPTADVGHLHRERHTPSPPHHLRRPGTDIAPPHPYTSRPSPPPAIHPTEVGYPEVGYPRGRRYSPYRSRSYSPRSSYDGYPRRRDSPLRYRSPDRGHRRDRHSPSRHRYRRRSFSSPSLLDEGYYPPDRDYRRHRRSPSRYRYRRRSFSSPSLRDEGYRSPGFRYGLRPPISPPRSFEDERDEGGRPHRITIPRSQYPHSEFEEERDEGSPQIITVPPRRPPLAGPPTVIRHPTEDGTPRPTILTVGPGDRGLDHDRDEDHPLLMPTPRPAYHPDIPEHPHPAGSIMEHDEGETPRPGIHRLPEERTIRGDERAHPSPEARRVPIRPSSSSSIIRHVPPRRGSDASDLGYGDAEREREREERLREMEGRIRQTELTLTETEDQRETEFRRNEEERNRLFREHEERRAAEARQRIGQAIPPEEDHRPDTARDPSPTGAAADSASLAESVRQASQDASARYATELLETVRSEREELARAREEAAAERERMAAQLREEREQATEARETRIRALEEELAAVKAELENERQLRITEEAETRERERQDNLERDEAVRNQLGDITNLVQEQRDLCARKKELMDERWSEKQIRRQEKDNKLDEVRELVNRIIQDREADRLRAEEERAAAEARPGIERVLEELQKQNTEQRDHLNALSETWRADCARQHQENLEAVRSTAQEQVPFNVQGYLNDFSKSLASEVRMLLGEVGKLREERRNLQYELGYMLCMKSKWGPGGEFEENWRPPGPGGPGGPPGDGPPPEPPLPPEEPLPAKSGWRNVPQRQPRRSKLKKEPPPRTSAPGPGPGPGPGSGLGLGLGLGPGPGLGSGPGPIPGPGTGIDPRRQVASWATWQPDPALVPTPPSVEPTLLVPDRASPGLFGPRSPRPTFNG